MQAQVIDAHQHFWREPLPWMIGPYAKLAEAHGPDDLRPWLAAAGVDATVLVQVRHALDETAEFLAIAEREAFVAGVVGWVPLDRPDIGDVLARLRADAHGRWLVGVRHLVHDEADPEWLLRPEVRRGLAALAEAGLVFDLLARPRELPACLAIARDFPDLRLVLDHLGKPEIAAGRWRPWATDIAALAQHAQVCCKLSGLVTEADHATWSPHDLHPYVAHALDVFGAERCLFGSDWPVCRVAADYGVVKAALETLLADLGVNGAERSGVMGLNATNTYRLPVA